VEVKEKSGVTESHTHTHTHTLGEQMFRSGEACDARRSNISYSWFTNGLKIVTEIKRWIS